MHVSLFRPTMRRRYMHSVLTQLVEEDIGPGKVTKELAAAVSGYVGAAGGVAVTSTFTAVTLAAEALGLAPGDGVVLPALASAVCLDALRARGLRVLLADADADGGGVGAETVKGLLGDGVKAVFALQPWGLPFSWEPAAEAGLPVVEDLTCSLAPPPGGDEGLVPTQADLALLSLDGAGVLAAGTGALLVARKRSLLAALRGGAGNLARHQALANYAAALALAQLADVDADRARRLEIVGLYRAAVGRSRHEALGARGGVGAYAFVVRVKDSLAEVRQYARKHGVETEAAFEGCSIAGDESLADSCPNARKLALGCVLFPLYPMLGRKSVDSICKVLATLP